MLNSLVLLLFVFLVWCSLYLFPLSSLSFNNFPLSVKPFLLMAFLSYDNMCNVDRLKFLQEGIPVLEKFANVWQEIGKCIDPLHLRNHRRPECGQHYSPQQVKDVIPEANLMIAEQTFCWMGRFKKILNSMGKTHFHFVLHRLIKQRNSYTEYCHLNGKYPLLPSAKISKSSV